MRSCGKQQPWLKEGEVFGFQGLRGMATVSMGETGLMAIWPKACKWQGARLSWLKSRFCEGF